MASFCHSRSKSAFHPPPVPKFRLSPRRSPRCSRVSSRLPSARRPPRRPPHPSPHESTLYLMSTKRRTFLQQVALATAATQTQAPPKLHPRHGRAAAAYPRYRLSTYLHRTTSHRHRLPPRRRRRRAASAWADAASSATGKFSTAPTKATRPTTPFPRSGRRPAPASPSRACSKPACCRPTKAPADSAPTTPPACPSRRRQIHRRISPRPHRFRRSPCPSRVSLEAFTPFIPHEPDESGLPVAVLRYRVTNPGTAPATVSIAWSVENPTGRTQATDTRVNEYRSTGTLAGTHMHSADLPAADPMQGEFASPRSKLPAPTSPAARLAAGRWWNSPMLFWDDFSADGELGPEPEARNAVGALSPQPHHRARRPRRFHFPPRLAFPQPHAAPVRLEPLPRATKTPSSATTTPPASPTPGLPPNTPPRTSPPSKRRPAASPPPSAKPLARRRQGSRQRQSLHAGHTRLLPHRRRRVPRLRRRRRSQRLLLRQLHPRLELRNRHRPPVPRSPVRCAAPLSATSWTTPAPCTSASFCPQGASSRATPPPTDRWGRSFTPISIGPLRRHSTGCAACGPASRRPSNSPGSPAAGTPTATAFSKACSTTPTTWSSTAPIPCAASIIWAPCAPAKKWRAPWATFVAAAEYRRLFESGRQWIDANLFNGEYYIQKIRGVAKDKIAPRCAATWAPTTPRQPQYQVGEGCLLDQLVGQYLAEVAGLGPLVSTASTSAKRWRPFTATTTSARSPITTPCSAPSRSTTKPPW